MKKRSDMKRQAILEAAYELFREKGFEKTSVAEINARAGGSKATIYSYFRSKEEIFVECMFALAERYLEVTLGDLQHPSDDVGADLQAFGASFLRLVCSPDMVSLRRLMIAEAERAGIGRLFHEKLACIRGQVALFIEKVMADGRLRAGDADLAASQIRALLEAELVEPLLLLASDGRPDDRAIVSAAGRAVDTFMQAYAMEAR
ncbi:MAG: TetR/AcrR family transcriptional regulator [Betaproteobacteria bacterium HGW-Betaproteobacteria-7]|jgi:AcrR family transcriptional regulator|nr:MAG: TetR/AcrR family transcriptional regulator [Betaproteobacteria bacterium HGW-Betaproteobacteria-7]